MDTLRFQPPRKGTAGLVNGKVGRAVQFHFDKDARAAFATSNIHGTPDWDRAAGFSFWVKGDGSDQFAGLEFIFDEDYAVRYDYAFPVKGTDWTQGDRRLGRPDPRPARPEGRGRWAARTATRRRSSRGLWIGRWWYWGDYPALTFAIDDIRLEPTIDRDANGLSTCRRAAGPRPATS